MENVSEEKKNIKPAEVLAKKEPKQCPNCGYAGDFSSNVCPNCGLPLHTAETSDVRDRETEHNEKKVSGKKKLLAAGIIAIIAVVILVICIFSGPSVEEIIFEQDSYYTNVGDVGSVDYTILPEEAAEEELQWSSSDNSVATVGNSGVIYGVSNGECTITATAPNGVEASFELEVRPDYTDFTTIYNTVLSPDYAQVASDGSYLLIDTNPNDYDDYSDDDALTAILLTIELLELPDSVVQKMGGTSALDGRQTQVYDGVEVSWTYHPDRGLEVLFSRN